MYHCTNCGAERDQEKRFMADNILRLQIIYECGSYRELMRIGYVWKQTGEVFKCQPVKMRVA